MKYSYATLALAASVFALAVFSAGCAGEDARELRAVGALSVSLRATSTTGITYRLREGTFEITGPKAATLSTEDDPSAQFLHAELPAGAYLAHLESGWFLEKQTTPGTFERVDAALTSSNPVAFEIADRHTTTVTFRFKAGDDVLELGGRLEIGIDVEETAAGCRLHADCESLACDTYAAEGRGECIDPARVLYVGHGSPTQQDLEDTATGTLANPFHRIQDAVTAAGVTAKDVIRVMPTPYTSPFSVSGQKLHIIGPAGEGGEASVFEEDGGAVFIGGGDVVLDGFNLGGPTHSALQCGGGRVVVRRSTLNSESITLRATGCVVELDRVRIAGFRSAIDFKDTQFSITNAFVGGFVEGRPAVLIQGGEGLFRFSTLAVFAEPTFGRGTIDCGASSVLIQDSIVAGNNLFEDSASRFRGACALERVVVADDPIASPGAIRKSPVLSDDYRLLRNVENLDCCIDRSTDDALIRWDIEGTPRPQGPRSDLGAYEASVP